MTHTAEIDKEVLARGDIMQVMPFGKYRGRRIDALPSSYLRWLAENMAEDKPRERDICLAADKEYQWRERHGSHFEEMTDGSRGEVGRCPKCGHVL